MLGVDVGGHAARLLRLGDDVLRQRRLATRLGSVDLRNAAARDAADAEGHVQGDRAGGDGFDLQPAGLAHLHDRALAELALDRRYGQVNRLVTVAHAVTPFAAASSTKVER